MTERDIGDNEAATLDALDVDAALDVRAVAPRQPHHHLQLRLVVGDRRLLEVIELADCHTHVDVTRWPPMSHTINTHCLSPDTRR